jgi:hypothetical protein
MDVEGGMATLAVSNTDPIGRIGVIALAGLGNRGTWRGGSLALETRRAPVHVGVSGWHTEQQPSEQKAYGEAPSSFDARYVGAAGDLSYSRQHAVWGVSARVGGTGGFLDGKQLDRESRTLGVGEVRGRLTTGVGRQTVSLAGGFEGARGTTAGDNWSLGVSRGSLTVSQRTMFVRLEATAGHVSPAGGADFGRAYEQFLVGGSALPFADAAFHGNRIVLPGVPVGLVSGQRVGVARMVLGGRVVEPSVTWVAGGDRRTEWKRVYAVERELIFPSLGYARLPAVRVRAGVSYSVDAPFERKVRPYVSLVYRP